MRLQIIYNLLLAAVWMLLHDVWHAYTFAVGYVIGFLLLFALRRLFPESFYGRKVWAVLYVILLFIYELLKSNWMVIRQITRPKLNIQPGVIKMETKLRSDWEITLISSMITLTPGSVVFEIDPQAGILYIHAIDVSNDHLWLLESKNLFEKAIMEVTR